MSTQQWIGFVVFGVVATWALYGICRVIWMMGGRNDK